MEQEGVDFTLKLGRALHLYGAPAHRLEDAMTELVEGIGVEGHFFSTPTAIFASFGSGDDRRVELIRIEGGEVDLGKMSELNELVNRVNLRRTTLAEASSEVDRIVQAAPRYGGALTLAAFGLTSAAASRFFGAGANEMLLSLIAGLAVGSLALASSRLSVIARLFEPLAGFVVSLFAVLATLAVGAASVPIVTVAGLIVLVPGLTLTVAVSELAQRNLVSGTARLHSALIVFLMLGFGVAMGGQLGVLIIGRVPATSPIPLPLWTEAVAVVVASVTLTVLFRAPSRDLGWIVLTCALTFASVRQGSISFGPELGVFLGALVAGVLSNLYARSLERPAAVTRVPAMMLLVPGGLGFLSISSLLEQDVLSGVATAFRVAVMAVALVTGLIISSAILPPGRKL